MEVHHHAHTERKKWTHYFWEFFMLFLAVTLGFFVENLREYGVEKKREKQFIHSLINDITADTARLNNLIKLRDQREVWLDSLSFIMNSEMFQTFPTSEIYYYAVYVPRSIQLRFLPNDGTLQQLKNAGGLRLIHNAEVADSIVRYDVGTRNLIGVGKVEEDLFEDFRGIAHKFFNGVVFDSILDANNLPHRLPYNPKLYSFKPEDLHEFNYKLFSIKAYNRASRRESRRLLQQAENLLIIIKREYNL